MARKFYTVFILPHAQARFRKVHLSKSFVGILAAVAAVVVLAGLATPHLLLQVSEQSDSISRLERERDELRAEKDRFEGALSEMGSRLNRFETQARELATALGIEELPAIESAAGGGTEADLGGGIEVQEMLDEELHALDLRTDGMEQSLERISDSWKERERLLASTPSTMPVRGWFSDGYGWRKDPISAKREFHKGVDIVAPIGAVVRAPADGVVTRAGRTGGYGRMVDLSHGFGYRTRYGHLSEILVEPGQRISRGDAIGRVGSTGRSTGPHLHYEVIREGRRVNPWKYLGDRK